MWRSTLETWGSLSKLLHWGMATLILTLFGLGWTGVLLPTSPIKLEVFFWHKSLGVLALGLVLIRIAWRISEPTPRLPPMPKWQRMAARVVEGCLYLLMLAVPLSGWAIQSASNFPFKLFGLFSLPTIIEPGKAAKVLAGQIHLTLFWIFAVLLVLHIGAALRHHFLLRDQVLRRMWPDSPRRPAANG